MSDSSGAPIVVSVLFFAAARHGAGADHVELALPRGATVSDALALLAERHPALRELLPSLLAAINEEWAPRTATLREGDTLAVMPPVSGG